jgi:hypothetical protein
LRQQQPLKERPRSLLAVQAPKKPVPQVLRWITRIRAGYHSENKFHVFVCFCEDWFAAFQSARSSITFRCPAPALCPRGAAAFHPQRKRAT